MKRTEQPKSTNIQRAINIFAEYRRRHDALSRTFEEIDRRGGLVGVINALDPSEREDFAKELIFRLLGGHFAKGASPSPSRGPKTYDIRCVKACGKS